MKQRAFAVILTLALVSVAIIPLPTVAEGLPEIEITWLTASGRPEHYIRENHTLELTKNTTCVSLDLLSGEVSSGWAAEWHTNVPISFEHGQVSIHRNSDGSPMGLCVADAEGKFGFVDTEGELIIPCEYGWIYPSDYAESFAVCLEGKWGFVDTSNELFVPFVWSEAYGFYENRAPVAREDETGNMKYGYIDRSGNVVIPLEYDNCGAFHEGLAVVAREDEYEYPKWGYIDSSGNVVVPLEYGCCKDFEQGLAAVGWEDVRGEIVWGCIDRSGHMVLPVEYECDSIFDFYKVGCQAGLIAAGKSGKYGCFNVSGEMILPMEYDDMEYLSDGMYMVQKGASYGIFESPYWHDSDSTEGEIKSTNSSWGAVITVLVIGIGGAGLVVIISLKRRMRFDN